MSKTGSRHVDMSSSLVRYVPPTSAPPCTNVATANAVTYEPPASTLLRGIVVAFHGGCFVGGSTSWDRAQNEALAARGLRVHQIELPKTWSAFREQYEPGTVTPIDAYVVFGVPFFVVGRSSGGFLAKFVHDHHPDKVTKSAYLCPVFGPRERARLLSAYADKTETFFGPASRVDSLTCDWNGAEERLYLASDDDHVPTSLFTPEQLAEARYAGPRTHAGMTTCSSAAFVDDLVQWFLDPVPASRQSRGGDKLVPCHRVVGVPFCELQDTLVENRVKMSRGMPGVLFR